MYMYVKLDKYFILIILSKTRLALSRKVIRLYGQTLSMKCDIIEIGDVGIDPDQTALMHIQQISVVFDEIIFILI